MKRHVRIFCNHRRIGEQDLGRVLCEWCCRKPMVDVHHIQGRGMGGDPQHKKDSLDNLIGLCRECHDKAEAGRIGKEALKERAILIIDILEGKHD